MGMASEYALRGSPERMSSFPRTPNPVSNSAMAFLSGTVMTTSPANPRRDNEPVTPSVLYLLTIQYQLLYMGYQIWGTVERIGKSYEIPVWCKCISLLNRRVLYDTSSSQTTSRSLHRRGHSEASRSARYWYRPAPPPPRRYQKSTCSWLHPPSETSEGPSRLDPRV